MTADECRAHRKAWQQMPLGPQTEDLPFMQVSALWEIAAQLAELKDLIAAGSVDAKEA